MEKSRQSKFSLTQQQLQNQLCTLTLPSIVNLQAETQQSVKELQGQIQSIQNDSRLKPQQQQQLIAELQQQILSLYQQQSQLIQQIQNSYRTSLLNEIDKYNAKHAQTNPQSLSKTPQQQQHFQQSISNFVSQQSQIWKSPKHQLLNTINQSWIHNPLQPKLISLQMLPNQPLHTQLHSNLSLTIPSLLDSQGKPFSGTLNLLSTTCDSLKEPQKLKSFPNLLVLDSSGKPTKILVSFSMQANQFEDEKGNLLFSTEPLEVVQKIDKNIDPEVLKNYKVYNWDVVEQKWVETGSVEVSKDGTELKYLIQPKSKEEMIRQLSRIGLRQFSGRTQFLFFVQKIRDLIPLVKELSQAYELEDKLARIDYQNKLVCQLKKLQPELVEKDIKYLNQETEALRKTTEKVRLYGKCVFYDLVSDYFLAKPCLGKYKFQEQEELHYFPEALRKVEVSPIYQSLIKESRESVRFQSDRTLVPAGTKLDCKSGWVDSIINFKRETPCSEQLIIKQVYLESPNKKFLLKFILLHPKTQIFSRNWFLQTINQTLNVPRIIDQLNQDTLAAIAQTLQAWNKDSNLKNHKNSNLIKDTKSDLMKDTRQTFIKETKQEVKNKGFSGFEGFDSNEGFNIEQIYKEKSEIVADLMIDSRLGKFKLSSTNRFLLRLQMAVLFSLTNSQILQIQQNLVFAQQPLLKQISFQSNSIKYPQFKTPEQTFLQDYTDYFNIYAKENDTTIREICDSQIKNLIQLSQKKQMNPLLDQQFQKVLSEIHQVFDMMVGKGLIDDVEMQKLKKTRIDQVKKDFIIDAQWNDNQTLVQRVIDDFFPRISSKPVTYDELIEMMTRYCKTREILMSKYDIYKFSVKFQQKYKDCKNKLGEGLPGGVEADAVQRDLIRRFGIETAKKAMQNISNIDFLTNLTEEQIGRLTAEAERLERINNSNKKAEDYLEKIKRSSSNLSFSSISTKSTESLLSESFSENQKQKNKFKSVLQGNVGRNDSDKGTSVGNSQLNAQFMSKSSISGDKQNQKLNSSKKDKEEDEKLKKLKEDLKQRQVQLTSLIDSYLSSASNKVPAQSKTHLNGIKAQIVDSIEQANQIYQNTKTYIEEEKRKLEDEERKSAEEEKKKLEEEKKRLKEEKKKLDDEESKKAFEQRKERSQRLRNQKQALFMSSSQGVQSEAIKEVQNILKGPFKQIQGL